MQKKNNRKGANKKKTMFNCKLTKIIFPFFFIIYNSLKKNKFINFFINVLK